MISRPDNHGGFLFLSTVENFPDLAQFYCLMLFARLLSAIRVD
jgi:hypothetical protein